MSASQPERLVVGPVVETAFIVSKQSEAEFDPGVDYTVERHESLEKVGARQAYLGAVGHNKAMGELHWQEDVGWPVAYGLDADAILLDSHHNFSASGGGRWNIIRNYRELVETVPVLPN